MRDPITNVRIIVELTVEAGSSWGDDCTLGQVAKQATEGALRTVSRVLSGEPIGGDLKRVSVSGTRVLGITTSERERS